MQTIELTPTARALAGVLSGGFPSIEQSLKKNDSTKWDGTRVDPAAKIPFKIVFPGSASGSAGLNEVQRLPNSLNDGNCVQPASESEQLKNTCSQKKGFDGVINMRGAPGKMDPPDNIIDRIDKETFVLKSWTLRDWINSSIRENKSFFINDFSNEYDDFLTVYEKFAKQVFNISDGQLRKSEKQSEYREKNFHLCHSHKREGQVSVNPTGEQAYYQVFSCSEKGCLRCDYQQRYGKVALKWINAIENISLVHKENFPGVVGIVWTFPEDIESDSLYDNELRKKIHYGIHDIIRKLFWCVKGECGEADSRPGMGNIGVHFFDHAVGDSDIFRDRFHIHTLITPAIISTSGKLEFLKPAPYVRLKKNGKIDNNPFMIDFAWLRNEWKNLLNKLFNLDLEKVSNPEYNYFGNPAYLKKHKITIKNKGKIAKDTHDDFIRKIHHRYKYDSRHFSKDFEKSVVLTDTKNETFIVKCEDKDSYYWRNVPGLEFVERYKFVRDNTKCESRGFWQRFETYKSVLCGVVLQQKTFFMKDIKKMVGPVDLKIEEDFKTVWNNQEKKLIKEKQILFYFKNPVTGEQEARPPDKMKRLVISI